MITTRLTLTVMLNASSRDKSQTLHRLTQPLQLLGQQPPPLVVHGVWTTTIITMCQELTTVHKGPCSPWSRTTPTSHRRQRIPTSMSPKPSGQANRIHTAGSQHLCGRNTLLRKDSHMCPTRNPHPYGKQTNTGMDESPRLSGEMPVSVQKGAQPDSCDR